MGGGPVLEFCVGTGRLAVPLAQRGFDVVGVDISPEMLAQLWEKGPFTAESQLHISVYREDD